MALVKKFEENPDTIKFLNSTTLVFIPKKENVKDIKHLKPISLLNCSYKIITKMLTTRLSKYIDKLITLRKN